MNRPENRNAIARPQIGITRRQALAGVASAAALAGFGGTALAAKKLKVAAVFATPIEEPWDHQIHVALLQAKEKLGIDYKWSEHVESSDFERVLRQYARGGTQLIMGDAFAAEEVTARSPSNSRRSPSCSAPAAARPIPISACSTTGSTSRLISAA